MKWFYEGGTFVLKDVAFGVLKVGFGVAWDGFGVVIEDGFGVAIDGLGVVAMEDLFNFDEWIKLLAIGETLILLLFILLLLLLLKSFFIFGLECLRFLKSKEDGRSCCWDMEEEDVILPKLPLVIKVDMDEGLGDA